MARSVRFCIRCGKEIGNAPFCPNPDCFGLPNYYRDIPAPYSKEDFETPDIERRTPTKVAHEEVYSAPDHAGERPSQSERFTVPIPATPVAVLRSTSSPAEEHYISAEVTLIGARAPATIIIDRPEISSKHAQILCRQGKVKIVDQGSTNGTFVNGEQIQSYDLSGGEKIRFAKVEYRFHLLANEEDGPRVTVEM